MQVSPAPAQGTPAEHAAPEVLHLPDAQSPSTAHKLLSSAHVPAKQLLSEKHVELIPAHNPGLHSFEAHAASLVHAAPSARRSAHAAGLAAASQNSPSRHWADEVHAPPAASRARQVPAEQKKPVAQAVAPHG